MPGSADLIIRIITDASKAGDGIDQATSKMDAFRGGLAKAAVPAAAVLAGITALGVQALGAASDLQQAAGSVEAVFGDGAKQIEKWASTASQSVGLSAAEYSNFAAVVGSQLKNLGVPMDQVAGNTDALIKLGADLAATYGGTTADAVSALSSALRGEADPAERYGLALNQTAVNAQLAEQGLTGLTGQAATAAKAQTIMAMATEQAGGAVGQFSKEADTLSGQQQRLNASWTDAAAALGQALLPVITPIVQMLAQFAQWVAKNSAVMGPLIAAVAALAAGILVLNVVMAANPIGLLIVAIGALIAGIVVLWNTNEGFRNFFIGIWQAISAFFIAIWQGMQAAVNAVVSWFTSAWAAVSAFFTAVWRVAFAIVQAYINVYVTIFKVAVAGIQAAINAVVSFFTSAWQGAVSTVSAIIKTLQGVFTTVFNAIKKPIDAVVNAFEAVIDAIKNVINWISKIKIPNLGGLFGGGAKSAALAVPSSAAGVMAYTGPRAAGLSAASSAGGGLTINVNGGLDSADTIARRIQQLLDARTRRAGGVTIRRATT